MTKICFFNHYHNGDLYHSKAFVKQVVDVVGRENAGYAHQYDRKVIQDLGISHVVMSGIGDQVKFFYWQENDVFFINTWIGAYFKMFTAECTLRFNMKMWEVIFQTINENFKTNLKLGPIENYLPYVDYRAFKVDQIDDWLQSNTNKKIMFSNGLVHSGQCDYNGDMADIINEMAEKHTDKVFLTTNAIKTSLSNIIHTSEIIRSDTTDLNEISYLSRACSMIVGRNSGPFCFASTGENLNDSSKTFYAFGDRETDCFTLGIPLKCNYIFEKYKNYEQIKNTLRKLVSEQ